MVKIISGWERLELIVADIQRELAPEAQVRHNHRVLGKSGRLRKLDVTITQTISMFPVFIVFDCKHHRRPVKLNDVEAFAGQLEDVSANLGVMVSSSGFDAGAQAVASRKNIILQTYRKAGEADWKALFGESAWVILSKVEIFRVKAVANILGNSAPMEIPFDTAIYDDKGEVLDSLKNIFWNGWKEVGQQIGDIICQLKFEDRPGFVKLGDEFVQVLNIMVNAKIIAKKYLVNLHLTEGKVLEEGSTSEPVYRSVASQGFDWAEILNTQVGIELTPEEYYRLMSESKLSIDLNGVKRYIRLFVQHKSNGAKVLPEQ